MTNTEPAPIIRRQSPLPQVVDTLLRLFEDESAGYTKLHRMIDAFEACLKFMACIMIQSFYSARLNEQAQDLDKEIRTCLRKPSTGHWLSFVEKVFGAIETFGIGGIQSQLLPAPPNDALRSAISRLAKLRNDLAHGTVLTDVESHIIISNRLEDLKLLLHNAFPNGTPDVFVVKSIPDAQSASVTVFSGRSYAESLETTIGHADSSRLTVGHVYATRLGTGAVLDLHPLVIFQPCRQRVSPERLSIQTCGKQRLLFFNGVEDEKRLKYLDMLDGHHNLFDKTDFEFHDFMSRFPAYDWKDNSEAADQPLIQLLTDGFVGRISEQHDLNAFVAGSTQKVLVLHGPPGTGKSSLLASWWRNQHYPTHFCRDNDLATTKPTEVLSDVIKKVAAKYNGKVSHLRGLDPSRARQALIDTIASIPNSFVGPVVIVIDGVDEAIRLGSDILDWLPSPERLPSNVRIVLSCRTEVLHDKTFRKKFRNHASVSLKGLTDGDIREMLEQSVSKYDAIENEVFVRAIVERSEGSPLYVRLMIEDLRRGLRAFGNLKSLPTGLREYYDDLLDRVREKDQSSGPNTQNESLVEDLLQRAHIAPAEAEKIRRDLSTPSRSDVLALHLFVKEPISRPEAAAIMARRKEEIDELHHELTSLWADADADKVQIFHSSFREYCLDQEVLTRHQGLGRSLSRIEKSILSYCAKWPLHKSAYVLQHLAAHYSDGDEWKALRATLTKSGTKDGWAAARYSLDTSYAGFLADLDVAWSHAYLSGDEPSLILEQVEYALIRTSVNSLASSVPAPMLAPLVQYGMISLENALRFATTIIYAGQRHDALSDLAKLFAKSQQTLDSAVWQSLETEDRQKFLISFVRDAGIDQLEQLIANSDLGDSLELRKVIDERIGSIHASRSEMYQAAHSGIEEIEAVFSRDQEEWLPALERIAEGLDEAGLGYALKCIAARADWQVPRLFACLTPRITVASIKPAFDILVNCAGQSMHWLGCFTDLAPKLASTLLDDTLKYIATLEYDGYQLLEILSRDMRQSDLEAFLMNQPAKWHVISWFEALIGLSHRLSLEYQRAIIQTLEAYTKRLGASSAARYLARLVGKVDSSLLEEAWTAANKMLSNASDESEKTDIALSKASILAAMPSNVRNDRWAAELAYAQNISDRKGRTLIVAKLAPVLPVAVVHAILQQAVSDEDDWERRQAERDDSEKNKLRDSLRRRPGPILIDPVLADEPEEQALDPLDTDWMFLRFAKHYGLDLFDAVFMSSVIDIAADLPNGTLRMRLFEVFLRAAKFGEDPEYSADYNARMANHRIAVLERMSRSCKGEELGNILQWVAKKAETWAIELVAEHFQRLGSAIQDRVVKSAVASNNPAMVARLVPLLPDTFLRYAVLGVRERNSVEITQDIIVDHSEADWVDDDGNGWSWETVEQRDAYELEYELWKCLSKTMNLSLLTRIWNALRNIDDSTVQENAILGLRATASATHETSTLNPTAQQLRDHYAFGVRIRQLRDNPSEDELKTILGAAMDLHIDDGKVWALAAVARCAYEHQMHDIARIAHEHAIGETRNDEWATSILDLLSIIARETWNLDQGETAMGLVARLHKNVWPEAFSFMLPHLERPQRDALVESLIPRAPSLGDATSLTWSYGGPFSMGKAMSGLLAAIHQLDTSAQRDAITLAFGNLCSILGSGKEVEIRIDGHNLAIAMGNCETSTAIQFLRDLLKRANGIERIDFLKDLPTLAGLLKAIGYTEVVEELPDLVRHVCTQWP